MYDKHFEISDKEKSHLISIKDRPIREFLNEMSIEKRMQDILLYAIGNINENQYDELAQLEKISAY